MKRIVPAIVLSAFLSAGAGAQVAPIAQSTTDLFDVSTGVVVTDTSGVTTGSAISAAFGALGGDEPGNVLMLDLQPQPFVHWIEWRTPSSVKVGHDSESNEVRCKAPNTPTHQSMSSSVPPW
jgi:hypothetical protein